MEKEPDDTADLNITGHLVIRDGVTKKEIVNVRDDKRFQKHVFDENAKSGDNNG